jgi:hypothetical protein
MVANARRWSWIVIPLAMVGGARLFAYLHPDLP